MDKTEADIDAIIAATHGDPFSVLGMHGSGKSVVVRTFQPSADRVWVTDRKNGKALAELPRVRDEGFFAGPTGQRGRFSHAFRIEKGGVTEDVEDPYRFPALLGDTDVYLIAEGNHQHLHDRLGAHPMTLDGAEGTGFAVWAPSAERVSVVGAFNGWDGRMHPMRRRVECGVWELFVPGVGRGEPYKFEIRGAGGHMLPLKADPLAFLMEQSPGTASVTHGMPRHEWADAEWMRHRQARTGTDAPISIYECHLGSWMRSPDDGNRYLTYRELADRLIPYVKHMGFTHIEVLPITEYPFDGSWGYQPVGLYAPTSRFGTPEDFAAFVDRCHAEDIGLLLDWVPGHFPTDAHGLARFDGTHLYEHSDPRQGFHQDWNTLIFNYGRNEVRNYLHANALFWLDRYHLDGLRVDAVASMLYLDYSRSHDQWVPNRYGGRENLEAIDFLKRMNELAYGSHPGAMTVAEESTAWPGVSRPTYLGGLGFGFKWNMGWMHDTLRYMSKEPVYRRYHHHDMTFGLLYAFSENFMLPLSHDEVVHGKGSLINKMPGDDWQKAANLRAYYGFMWGHPGKKLLFMGGEFGQEREWNHNASLDWHLLDDPRHKGIQSLVRDLNLTYCATPAMHKLDCSPDGFEWIEANDSDNSVIAFIRRGEDPEATVVVVSNFTPVPRHGFRIGVSQPGWYREAINTDFGGYAGSGVGNGEGVMAESVPAHGRPFSLNLTLPPLATLWLERQPG